MLRVCLKSYNIATYVAKATTIMDKFFGTIRLFIFQLTIYHIFQEPTDRLLYIPGSFATPPSAQFNVITVPGNEH